MWDIIGYSIIIGMVVNMITSIPLYAYLNRLGKPFSCIFCLTFWICVVIGTFNMAPLPITNWLLVTLSAPYVSDIMERLKNALPIKLK